MDIYAEGMMTTGQPGKRKSPPRARSPGGKANAAHKDAALEEKQASGTLPNDAEAIPWTDIKAEYIAGGTSYRTLGEKYGVPFKTIAEKGKREAWGKLRERTSRKADNALADKVARVKAETLESLLDATIYTVNGLKSAAAIASAAFMPTTGEDGNVTLPVVSGKTIGALQGLATAIANTQKTLFVQLGILTPSQAKAYEINLRRVKTQELAVTSKHPEPEKVQIVIQPPSAPPPDEEYQPDPQEEPTTSGIEDYLV